MRRGKKSIQVLFLSLVMPQMLLAQSADTVSYLDYYRFVNEGRYSMYHQDYSQAKTYYAQAFSLGLAPANYDRYDYARVLCEMGDTSSAISILKTLTKTADMQRDSTYFTDIALSTRQNLAAQAEERRNATSEKFELNEDEKYVQKLAEHIFAYRSLNLEQISGGDSIRRKQLMDSLTAVGSEKYRQIGEYLVQKGLGSFRVGLDYSNNSDIKYFLFQADSMWYVQNLDFLKRQVALGNLSPTVVFNYNRHLGAQLKDTLTSPEAYFKLVNEWGISPYFELEYYYHANKGFAPARMRYYDLYEQEKYRFNCTDFNAKPIAKGED